MQDKMKLLDSINRLKLFPKIYYNKKINKYSLTNDWDGVDNNNVVDDDNNNNSMKTNTFDNDIICIPPPILPSQPMSICIRMGIGSFSSYTRQSILHCGISDSNGKVYHFDENGYNNESNWYESLSMQLIAMSPINNNNNNSNSNSKNYNDIDEQIINKEQWDENLKRYHIYHQNNLQKCIYHAKENNCYDYVTDFLNMVQWNNFTNHTKNVIVKTYLEPLVLNMENYLYMWKELVN